MLIRTLSPPQPSRARRRCWRRCAPCTATRLPRDATLVLMPHTVFFGIQGLWISRWLSDVARYSEEAVGYLLYLGMAAVIFGAIAVGMVTEWAGGAA
jgi:hypothetical protein